MVLGLFTWDDRDPAYSHRELDVELSRWTQADNENCQFVVQPYTQPERIERFMLPPSAARSVHTIVWKPTVVSFSSQTLARPASTHSGFAKEWKFAGDSIPVEGITTNARINFWLVGGMPPADASAVEVVISKFEFEPLRTP